LRLIFCMLVFVFGAFVSVWQSTNPGGGRARGESGAAYRFDAGDADACGLSAIRNWFPWRRSLAGVFQAVRISTKFSRCLSIRVWSYWLPVSRLRTTRQTERLRTGLATCLLARKESFCRAKARNLLWR